MSVPTIHFQWPRRIPTGLAVVMLALVIACNGGSGPSDNTTPTRTPLPTGTITATGDIAYITTDGHVALTDPTGSATQVISDFDETTDIAWSPDGSKIASAYGGGGAGVSVLSPAGDELYKIEGAVDPLWAPQGGRLSVVRDSDIVVVDEAGNEERTIEHAARPAWSPDGAELAYLKLGVDGRAVPVIMDLEAGEERDFGSDVEPAEPVYPIAWQPGGNVIGYKDALYEPATGETSPLEGVPIEWSPDGRLLLQTLAVGEDEGGGTTARLFDFTEGGVAKIGIVVQPSLQGIQPWLYIQRWIDWSADSRTFLYMDPQPFRMRARVFDTVMNTQLPIRDVEGVDPDISPSGTHAAISQGEKLWILALDGTALVHILDGTKPDWRPQG